MTTNVDDLVAATHEATVTQILVKGRHDDVPSLTLRAGVSLVGVDQDAELHFASGRAGLRLSADSRIADLSLFADPDQRSIEMDTVDAGTVELIDLTVRGQVSIVAGLGRLVVDGLHVLESDTRHRPERPRLSGVGALQGAVTVWNRDPQSTLTATMRRVSAGQAGHPVRGSGVLIAGRVEVDLLETGEIVTDGGIPDGTADTISGGVFVALDAHVTSVRNLGAVTTHGTNDMLLDNWGRVDNWTAHAPLTSYGRSGVGFVNFGSLDELRILAPIRTHGVGARGFNVYHLEGQAGASVRLAEFESITTQGDAAIGVQIGQPIGRLIVHQGIETHGGTGDSLVKGVITRLSAHAISVLPTGVIDELEVGGALISRGEGVTPLHVLGHIGKARLNQLTQGDSDRSS